MKAFIIRKPNDEISEKLSSEFIESAKQFGITAEKFDGVYNDHDRTIMEKGLFCFPKMKETKKQNLGFKGCFLSHFLLWEKCIELNQPIMILEHDALMIRPLPENILELFNYHCILDYAIHLPNYEELLQYDGPLKVNIYPRLHDNKISISKINHAHIKGSHAHLIKPLGAKILIESVRKWGHLASDATVNQYYTEFITIDPIPVRCHPFMTNKKNRQNYSHTK
jgi:GR25 family glycosyltransferase involved in LPS biosynthesis